MQVIIEELARLHRCDLLREARRQRLAGLADPASLADGARQRRRWEGVRSLRFASGAKS